MKAARFLGLAAALTLAVSATGCFLILATAHGDCVEIVHKTPKLTLAWDPPLSDIPNRPTEVASYQIYCREHGTPYWRFLGEIPATLHPEYIVQHSLLGDGLFDFAVRSIAKDGRASALHSSLDNNADPISGWYVLWAQSY